ncbi:MAG: rhodanese-like domain-containing protein [Saprospiraceae bacterium]|nr:rhodanese-like domain-containing protein [Saprospiraceae bacterium]
MKTTLIIVLVAILILGGIYGIKWIRVFIATDYYEMLTALYTNSVPLIKGNEIKKMEDWVILDVRANNEYDVSHIKGALWLGYPETDYTKLEDVPKNQMILVYCSVGYRSERVGEALLKKGYMNVKNLYGGIFEWVNCKKTIVDSEEKETDKIHGFDPSWGKWLNSEMTIVY